MSAAVFRRGRSALGTAWPSRRSRTGGDGNEIGPPASRHPSWKCRSRPCSPCGHRWRTRGYSSSYPVGFGSRSRRPRTRSGWQRCCGSWGQWHVRAEPHHTPVSEGRSDGSASRIRCLYGQVVSILRQNVLSGHVFGFCNRARTKVKLLMFDGSGLWVCAKRLEGCRFAWPQSGESEIDVLALQAVLSGFELKARRHWYRRPLPGARAPEPENSSST